MEPPRYVLLETNYGTYTTYGVALVDCSDEYPIILETVSDLSTDKERVRSLSLIHISLIPAFDGAEALNIFRDRKIDLIVLDIMLPKISGLAVLHEIRKSSNIPVIMLTAVDDEYTQSNSFDELADDYLSLIHI